MAHDLFVSYSRSDNEQGRVSRLVETIQSAFMALANRPLEVFIDRKIRPKEDWQHRILEELRESGLLLACISASYLESELCEWEYSEYVSREDVSSCSGEGVVPVYLDKIENWDARDYEALCAPWIAELRRRQRFDLTSWSHSDPEPSSDTDGRGQLRQISEVILEHIVRRERAGRNPGNLVDHNRHFLGRKAEIKRLRDQYVRPGTLGMIAAIHGLGGMGKTSLATAYAHRYAHEYGGGCWMVDCAGHDDLRLALATLQDQGELDFDFKEEEKADPDRKFERVLRELKRLTNDREPHRCLLVLDNVDRPELLSRPLIQRLPSARWLHVIVTTRFGPSDLVDIDRQAFLPVDELPEADGLALMEGYQQDRRFRNDADRSAALELIRLLGGFTLAVESAAVYLSQPEAVSCADFLKRLKAEGLGGLDYSGKQYRRGVDHGEKSLMATLSSTLDLLEPDERLALDYAALLPAECIAWEWLESLVGDEFRQVEMAAEVGHMERWTIIKYRLQSLRLLTPAFGPELARMHRLVQEVVRRQEDFKRKKLRPNLIEHALGRCAALEKHWRDADSRWELEPLLAWSRQLMAEDPETGRLLEEDDPKTGGMLESALGNLLQKMGRYRHAQELLAHALEAAQELYGPDDSRVATCMHDLGWVEWNLGNLPEAHGLSNRALAIDEHVHGADHTAVSRDLSLVGRVEEDLGNLKEARQLFEQALAIDKEAYEPGHPHLAIDYSNLGRVEQALTNSKEARRLFVQALAIEQEAYEPTHPELAISYSNLGLVERDLGNLKEAKRLFEQALAIDKEAYEPTHPHLAIGYSNLGLVERDLGNLKDANRLFEQALAINKEAYEPTHPTLAISYSNLGSVEQALGNLKEAKSLLEQALAIGEQVWEPTHYRLARIFFHCGAIEKQSGNLTEAKRLLQRAIVIWELHVSATHFELVEVYAGLASVEMGLGNLAEAETLARRGFEITIHFAGTTGCEHPKKQKALAIYTGILEATGMDQAEIMARVSEAEREHAVQPGSEQVIDA